MAEENAKVSMCSLENGCCERQIPYDMAEHDKILYQEGYAKAIDEFAERICDKATDDSLQVMLPDGFRADVVTLDYVTEIAVEIAKELKGGAE